MRECERTTWSNADTIWLLEQILSTNLVASRKHYLTRQNKELSKQEDLNTLLFAQDSAVVQMLLDACLSKPMLAGEQGAIDEVRCQICAFVHQQFISNPPLVRLVHFQVCVPCINEGRCVRYATLTNVDEQCVCVCVCGMADLPSGLDSNGRAGHSVVAYLPRVHPRAVAATAGLQASVCVFACCHTRCAVSCT